ncbi:hypothetical protein ACFFX0_33395 [Citricoccus parietis]|uniref:Uncharacterized protein n=1 Tax=Citricoccus parietis TaxID=592307 RepID=A0ABV5GAY5_9MICC
MPMARKPAAWRRRFPLACGLVASIWRQRVWQMTSRSCIWSPMWSVMAKVGHARNCRRLRRCFGTARRSTITIWRPHRRGKRNAPDSGGRYPALTRAGLDGSGPCRPAAHGGARSALFVADCRTAVGRTASFIAPANASKSQPAEIRAGPPIGIGYLRCLEGRQSLLDRR